MEKDNPDGCQLHITPLPSNGFCRAQVQKEGRVACKECQHGKPHLTGPFISQKKCSQKNWIQINNARKDTIIAKPKKEEVEMPVPKDRQCTDESGCVKFAVKGGLCTSHYKAKYGEAPKWGTGEKTKKTTKAKTDKAKHVKTATVKPSGNGSKSLAGLMAMISQAGKEQLREEMAPMFQDLRSRIDNIERFLN